MDTTGRMPMSQILALSSFDYPGHNVADLVHQREARGPEYPQDAKLLREDMRANGQRSPIAVADGMLVNGGDRVVHAVALGWPSMKVTPDVLASADVFWEDANYQYRP